MPLKKIKNSLIMLVNIGTTSIDKSSFEEEEAMEEEEDEGKSTFLDKAKCAMKILVQKKIFLQPKDEIGILTMGEETSDFEDVDNVKVYSKNLLVPNWEMVKYINSLKSTDYPSNWIEGLHAAIQYIRKEVVDNGGIIYLIVFHNFKEDDETIAKYDFDTVYNDLQKFRELHVLFLGENAYKGDSFSENNMSNSEKFALSIMKNTDNQFESINTFIREKQFYRTQAPSSVPWKFNLDWGGLEIPCSSFVKICDTSKLAPWKFESMRDDFDDPNQSSRANKSPNINVLRENILVDVHRNEIRPEKIINGYKFGGKYIPISEEDEIAMRYAGSKRGMTIYGFVDKHDVKLEYWCGKGSRVIVPANEEYATAFYSFVRAMVDGDYAAIVRKIYADNSVPKMGVLFPNVIDDDVWCLVHLDLPFVNDLRVVRMEPTDPNEQDLLEDNERIEAIENYIDSMTVDENEICLVNEEAFPNVIHQYQWDVLADRALNPDGPLAPVDDYIRECLKPPEKVRADALPHLDRLDRLFKFVERGKPMHETKGTILAAATSEFKGPADRTVTGNSNPNSTKIGSFNESEDDDLFYQVNVDLDLDKINDM